MSYCLTIELQNLKFYSAHGVFKQENVVGNEFDVSFRGELLSESLTLDEDELGNTVSYADVYETIKKEMSAVSKLIENVAYRILESIRKQWPQFVSLEVKITKCVPPVTSLQGQAAVTLRWNAKDKL